VIPCGSCLRPPDNGKVRIPEKSERRRATAKALRRQGTPRREGRGAGALAWRLLRSLRLKRGDRAAKNAERRGAGEGALACQTGIVGESGWVGFGGGAACRRRTRAACRRRRALPARGEGWGVRGGSGGMGTAHPTNLGRRGGVQVRSGTSGPYGRLGWGR
jgi:hypothetical protein